MERTPTKAKQQTTLNNTLKKGISFEDQKTKPAPLQPNTINNTFDTTLGSPSKGILKKGVTLAESRSTALNNQTTLFHND
jgi:hypothetical protein